jgi:prepilin-type N-terminal cleavage/methylation domain-containing protein
MRINNKKNISGLSLIEILIVITIFAVIGLLSTRSIFLTIRGAKKSDSLVRVRENVNYSLSVIERQLRNSESVTCPNASTSTLNYISLEGTATTFSCVTAGTDKYIASGSGRLTSSDITVTSCAFSCTVGVNTPPSVKVAIEATDNESTSVEKGVVSIQTEIVVRNY